MRNDFLDDNAIVSQAIAQLRDGVRNGHTNAAQLLDQLVADFNAHKETRKNADCKNTPRESAKASRAG